MNKRLTKDERTILSAIRYSEENQKDRFGFRADSLRSVSKYALRKLRDKGMIRYIRSTDTYISTRRGQKALQDSKRI